MPSASDIKQEKLGELHNNSTIRSSQTQYCRGCETTSFRIAVLLPVPAAPLASIDSKMKLVLLYPIIAFIVTTEAAVTDQSSSCGLITLQDYENYAIERLPKGLMDYLQRGADKDDTLERNTAAFSRVRLLPRLLRDVSNRTTEATALNRTFRLPVGLSPTGLHKRWTPEGELATVRAAASAGTIMIVSSAASVLLEDIAAEAPEAEKWLQLIIFNNKTILNDLVRRAENANYSAIVVTADMAVSALRYHNQRNQFKDSYEMVNYAPYRDDSDPDVLRRDSATWADLKNLVASTTLPIIVKGVLTPEDARLAHAHGAKGIIVSNHGGRQLDGSVSTLEGLSRIIHDFPEASYKGFDIYVDGGVRSGLDVFKALAIGAKFVFIGRPAVWGLFHSGQQGLEHVLEIFRKELDTVMGQAGCVTVDHINKYLVTPLPDYW